MNNPFTPPQTIRRSIARDLGIDTLSELAAKDRERAAARGYAQRLKLQSMIDAAWDARAEARCGDLFCSIAGRNLFLAMLDLTEGEDLQTLADDAAVQAGVEL